MTRETYQPQPMGEEVKEENSWRYPLIIFFATLLLCVIFLYYYVGPDVDEFQGNKPRPTINDEIFRLTVGDIEFDVPANYTVFPRDRRDGEREEVLLYASWPRMEGYVPARRNDFVENDPDSRRIDILILERKTPFTEAERLDVLYMPHTVDQSGQTYDHGLTRYTFRQGSDRAPASGYSDKEMLIGDDSRGEEAILFCYLPTEDNVVPPDCFREYDHSDRVAVRFYFKRAYLPEWQRIDTRVRELVDELSGSGDETAERDGSAPFQG